MRLSPAQTRVYDIVANHLEENGYPPTVREIGEALGYTSPATVQAHLDILRRKGLLVGSGRTLRLGPVPMQRPA